jgi:hypothetical protein
VIDVSHHGHDGGAPLGILHHFGSDLEFGFDGQIFEAAEGDLVAESAPDVERDAGVELLIDRRHHPML